MPARSCSESEELMTDALTGIYFFIVPKDKILTDEQYKRLKRQINKQWPKGATRPILLEGGMTVTKL